MSPDGHPSPRTLLARLHMELGPEECDAVDAHCRACPACRRDLEALSGTITLLETDKDLPPMPSVWTDVAARLQAGVQQRMSPAFKLGLAGCCAAGICLGVLVADPIQDTETTTTASVASDSATSGLWSAEIGLPMLDPFANSETTENEVES